MQGYGYGPPSPHAEHVFFQDHAVTITRSRTVIFGVTYATPNVTSVRTITIGRSAWPWILAMVLGFPSLLLLWTDAWLLGLLLGAMAVGCVVLFFVVLKPTYVLFLATSGREAQALRSQDQRYVWAVTQAIQGAMAAR